MHTHQNYPTDNQIIINLSYLTTSLNNKLNLIHSIITNDKIDILYLTNTWMNSEHLTYNATLPNTHYYIHTYRT